MALDIDIPSVRALIDIAFTADDLSDTVIQLDPYKGEALRYVGARTSNEDASAIHAANCKTAQLLIPAIGQILSESNAGYSYQMQQRNWTKRADELSAMCEEAITRSESLNPTTVGQNFNDASGLSHFDVAEARTLNWWEKLP